MKNLTPHKNTGTSNKTRTPTTNKTPNAVTRTPATGTPNKTPEQAGGRRKKRTTRKRTTRKRTTRSRSRTKGRK